MNVVPNTGDWVMVKNQFKNYFWQPLEVNNVTQASSNKRKYASANWCVVYGCKLEAAEAFAGITLFYLQHTILASFIIILQPSLVTTIQQNSIFNSCFTGLSLLRQDIWTAKANASDTTNPILVDIQSKKFMTT